MIELEVDPEAFATPPTQTRNDWSDITDEEWREYIFPGDERIRVNDPASLRVKRDHGYTGLGSRDSHRIEGKNGVHYYVPPGWIGLKFKAEGYSF